MRSSLGQAGRLPRGALLEWPILPLCPALGRPSPETGMLRAVCTPLQSSSTTPTSAFPKGTFTLPSTRPSTTWQGEGKTQDDHMRGDACILVDEQDCVTGSASKLDCHRFTEQLPSGLLHRAFSVFLFNSRNELLLQQRASHKITFPNMWTNTCCSHQLHDQHPPEVDSAADVSEGTVIGAKHAAVRKLGHELGIPADQLPLAGFKYLTRLHYCAADEGTRDASGAWGEHEMDFILLAKCNVDVEPNAEEVAAVKYVDAEGLRSMMQPASGYTWSPWFRKIVDNMLDGWWSDLDRTLSNKVKHDQMIHRL